MRDDRSLRGFVAGVLVGVLAGSAGMAVAAFGYNGWQRFSEDFKGGYLIGFIDMANLARNLDPGGWVDQKYPYLPQVKPDEWKAKINELYAQPENQKYTISSILQLAGRHLEAKHGKAVDPDQRVHGKMLLQMEAVRKAREKSDAAKAGEPGTAAEPAKAGEPGTAAEPAKAGEPGQVASAWPKPPKALDSPKVFPKPSKRAPKWCRCDGKDPDVERARRRAEAAKEEAEAAQQDAAKAASQKQAAPVTKAPATAPPAPATPTPAPAEKK